MSTRTCPRVFDDFALIGIANVPISKYVKQPEKFSDVQSVYRDQPVLKVHSPKSQ